MRDTLRYLNQLVERNADESSSPGTLSRVAAFLPTDLHISFGDLSAWTPPTCLLCQHLSQSSILNAVFASQELCRVY